MADALGLPDPSDYNAPTNWDARAWPAPATHPSGQDAALQDAGTETASDQAEQAAADGVPVTNPDTPDALTAAETDGSTVGPLPAAAPTVDGVDLTVNVNQG